MSGEGVTGMGEDSREVVPSPLRSSPVGMEPCRVTLSFDGLVGISVETVTSVPPPTMVDSVREYFLP